MTQRNIDVMDIIVSRMASGEKLSKALKAVYEKRNVCIPYNESYFDIPIIDLGLSRRSSNALLRAKMRKLGDVIEFCKGKKITDVANLGITSGIEIFETILDYCWNCMSQDEKASFLIDTVKRNNNRIRSEIEI